MIILMNNSKLNQAAANDIQQAVPHAGNICLYPELKNSNTEETEIFIIDLNTPNIFSADLHENISKNLAKKIYEAGVLNTLKRAYYIVSDNYEDKNLFEISRCLVNELNKNYQKNISAHVISNLNYSKNILLSPTAENSQWCVYGIKESPYSTYSSAGGLTGGKLLKKGGVAELLQWMIDDPQKKVVPTSEKNKKLIFR